MSNINISRWYKKESNIPIKYKVLLVLAGLHHHKHITDEKLKGQFSALRKGTIEKKKKTHHCDITDRWYDNEGPYEIYEDCITYKCLKEIPFKELIKYIALFENKGYNHALNVFGSQYIYGLFRYWNPEYHGDFSDYADFYIPGVKYSNNSYECYACGHSHSSYNKNERVNLQIINDWIHNMKKGNLSKIPKHDISTKTLIW